MLTTHPTWTSLGQFHTTKMRWSKFLIHSLKHWRLMMIVTTLKMHSTSIYEPTILSTWQAKKPIWKDWNACYPHQAKRFLISDNCTHNWQNTCNWFLKIDLVASLLDTIYLKKKWSSSSNIASTNALVRLNINKLIIKVETQPLYCIV